MLKGLSAFPLTPMNEDGIDEASFIKLIENLATADVDSIGALGSTGNYMYLSLTERRRIAQLAVEHAGDVPVLVCIGALCTRDVLELADDAQKVGASALLLPPVSYQKLTEDEVLDLYDVVTRNIGVPLCVYDNPGTTHFNFDDNLYAKICAMPNVSSVKIPGIHTNKSEELARIGRLRSVVPPHVTLGISGDAFAANGLTAGCDAWYSVIGGLFPRVALKIVQAAKTGDEASTQKLSEQLEPLWKLNKRYGSLRVIATAAEILGLVKSPSLPRPLVALNNIERNELASLIDQLELT